MKAEEKNFHVQLQKLKEEHNAAKESAKYTLRYFDEGANKIGDGLKNQNVIEVEAGNKLVEFGREKQTNVLFQRIPNFYKIKSTVWEIYT